MRRAGVAALVALALLPTGCGGDDAPTAADAARARATVCTARADIAREVAALRRLTPDLASVPQVKRAVTAITAGIARIRAAREDLGAADAATVETDAARLQRRAQQVTRATLSGGLAGDVRGALQPAIAALAGDARQAFRQVGC